jgi:hypothetical protein
MYFFWSFTVSGFTNERVQIYGPIWYILTWFNNSVSNHTSSGSFFDNFYQGVYIIRWDFNDYFMFHRVQLAPCRGCSCWKLAKIKLGLWTYWRCYMDVYSNPFEAHKIIWYFASLLHYYFLSFDTCKILTFCFVLFWFLFWKTEQLPVKFTKPSVKKSENFLAQKW